MAGLEWAAFMSETLEVRGVRWLASHRILRTPGSLFGGARLDRTAKSGGAMYSVLLRVRARGAKTRQAGISETAELKKDWKCRFSARD